jgi:hypothetical protein
MGDCLHGFKVWTIVIPILIIFVLLCIVPVTAADIDISIEGPGISNWAFTPGTTNIDSTNVTLNVSSISSTWTVSVKDNLDFSKPPITVGKMVEWDGTAYITPNPWVFGKPMNIEGPTVSPKTTGASVTLDGSNQIIESGHAPVTGLVMPLTISQQVAYTDPYLKGGHRYQIVVTFIAFAEGGPAPVVTGIVPAEGITGETVTITDLSGSNFLPHSTAVLNRMGSPDINLTVTGVTIPTRMTGTFNLAGAGVGLWDVTVTNPDSRTGTKPQIFWIKYPAKPGVSGFAPISGTRGKTTNIGVTGNYFQNGVAVNLTHGTSVITAVVSSVTPTRINGAITIPSNAPTGDWDLIVTNNDGQFDGMLGALTVE